MWIWVKGVAKGFERGDVHRCGDCTLHVLMPEAAVALTTMRPESGSLCAGEVAVATVLPRVSLIVVFTATDPAACALSVTRATEVWKVAPPPLV